MQGLSCGASITLYFRSFRAMYTSRDCHQISFFDFNQTCGLQLDKTNEWVLLADQLDWNKMEDQSGYATLFPGNTGHPTKPFRMAMGALIIQKRKHLSDRALVKEIAENPYLQYFIGCKAFQNKCPFTAPLLVSFRKRLNEEAVMACNEVFLSTAKPTPEHQEDDIKDKENENENAGTAILDATCSPSNIKYPQDFELLNDAREKLEEIIDYFHNLYHPWPKPRTYRKVARKSYLALAKAKKRTAKKIRMEIRRQLEHVRRDLGYLAAYMGEGYALPDKYVDYYLTILKLYEQQKYMYDNKTHQVSDRIVSISQPYIRPIVRGKAKAPVEFGAKYDVSVDEKGHVRLEKVSFTPYNECTIFVDAIERYYKRTGHYPERVLVDQIYRTRENRKYCKDHGIRMSGPKLGRPKANEPKQTKQEYQDNVDRIEVERFFSVDKRCSGAGLIMTKLEETSLCSIALSVFVTNLFAIPIAPYFLLFFWDDGCNYGKCHFLWIEEAV